MTDADLTLLSTILWLIGTGAFILVFGSWSADVSFGLTSTLVQGVRSWSGRGRPPSPAADDLPPINLPEPAAPEHPDRRLAPSPTEPLAVLEDLGARSLRSR